MNVNSLSRASVEGDGDHNDNPDGDHNEDGHEDCGDHGCEQENNGSGGEGGDDGGHDIYLPPSDLPECRCATNDITFTGAEWVAETIEYAVGSDPVLILPSLSFVGDEHENLLNQFKWQVLHEYPLMRWIYLNTESLYTNWPTFFPGYLDMPTNDDEFEMWLETAKNGLADPADWDLWMLNFMDLFQHPTSFECRQLEWSETIDACHYYLALENADTGDEVTAENDQFVMHFDPAGHVLVFGTDEPALVGESRNYIVHAVSSYSGHYDSVNLSFTIA